MFGCTDSPTNEMVFAYSSCEQLGIAEVISTYSD